ncbi:MAG: protein-disulfide reductase DsbD domain-containing protein, partial [Sphingomicrobium sp.]
MIAGPAGAAADPAKYIRAELIAESAVPRPGSSMVIGIRMIPRSGWHGYWSNPGESGFAPSVRWTAPTGVTVGPLLHPAPSLLKVGGLTSFVHEGPHILLARVSIPRSAARGTNLPLSATVTWAACTATQCVPLRTTLKLDLIAGSGTPGTSAAALRAAVRKLPRPAPQGRMTVAGDRVRLQLPPLLHIDPRQTRFFPETGVFAGASGATLHNGAIVIDASRR